ncbi:putative oxidoreductase [Alternaria alternata]|nr:putative oxidoreductase [Alternaria alternata]
MVKYKDPDYGKIIQKSGNNELKLAYNSVARYRSERICAAAITSKGGQYYRLNRKLFDEISRQNVKRSWTFSYTTLGERFIDTMPPKHEDYKFDVDFWRAAKEPVSNRKDEAHPVLVRDGLKGVPQGFSNLKGREDFW